MSYKVVCDCCGREQDAGDNAYMREPENPINPDTGWQWWSVNPKRTGKTIHACSKECRDLLPEAGEA